MFVASAGALEADSAVAAAPLISVLSVSNVSSASATLKADVNPEGSVAHYRFEYGTSACSGSPNPCTFVPKPEGEIPAGNLAVHLVTDVVELNPATIYHFRVVARNGEVTRSPEFLFATSGAAVEGLPDGRSYEQASPTDKDGGDAVGKAGLVKAAENGSGISFGNTFGVPGGKGAQALPSFLALRGAGESGWATQGLLPPEDLGQRAQVQGWLPDFSRTYSNAARLGNPRKKALVEQSTAGAPPRIIAAYTQNAEYSYVGDSPDGSTVFFESKARLEKKEGGALVEGTIDGKPNLYAWDRATGEVHLAGAVNTGKAPTGGTFAGPYDWSKGTTAATLREGGAARGYYLQGTHAITAAGDVYFTEAGTGQLYLRENPTQSQSAMEGEKCLEEDKACTIHVSASQRTVADPAGSQPAAFQAASADGSEVFFTSAEKLTNESNTGPDQPEAAISLGSSSTGAIENTSLVKKHALGVAVDGSHIYWADPSTGSIDRSGLNGSGFEELITPGSGECEVEVEVAPGVFERQKVEVPSTPRYVAIDAGSKFIYWSNTGLRDNSGDPIDGGGTIGRAELNGSGNVVKVEPAFICGASGPQGVAVNSTHIYWANAGQDPLARTIGRAEIDGNGVEQKFFEPHGSRTPYGIALSSTHLFFGFNEENNGFGYVGRVSLAGEEDGLLFLGNAGIRGVSVDASHVFWVARNENAIGRADLELSSESVEEAFVKGIEGAATGLAVDSDHLYWSVNGEAATNPGRDLYRFRPATGELKDLTVDVSGNGAEVQGVLGASEDGSHVYFAANGVLASGATQGDCNGSVAKPSNGGCSIYLLRNGSVSFVGRVKDRDSLAWTGTPIELFSTSGYTPKTSMVSRDGEVLLTGSQEQLTAYSNEDVPELYRYSATTGKTACVSCRPSGEAVENGPSLGTDTFPGPISPPLASVAMVQSRNLSIDGNRVFFETAEALVPVDTNGQAGCPLLGRAPACTDTYEWEAPGTGSCKESGPGYSPLNEGCIFLISTGKSKYPSLLADASETGNDVFFFTRQGLVGQDKDELQDVYDARVKGGLAAQNQIKPLPCEGADACQGAPQAPLTQATPGTPRFVGPGNAVSKHKSQKAKKHKAKKHKANRKNKRANTAGGMGR